MFRKNGKSGLRSNRDSGVASLCSLQSVHDSCRLFYKIHDLTVREEKYVRMLEILVQEYKEQFTLALDPYHYFHVNLTNYRALFGHERKIFYFFEHLLQLHRTFCDLLRDCEDATDVGQLFFDWISEGNLDIYVKHWLLNPLKRMEVQQEFDSFMSKCLDDAEILGLDAYTSPGIHLIHYKKTLASLCEICTSTEEFESLPIVERSLGILTTFLEHYNLSSDALEIDNFQVEMALVGKCLCRGEFIAREYAEGLKEKVIIYLFQRGLVVASPKKCSKSRTIKHVFHSFYDLRHIEVAPMEACIRLKNMTSGKTYYRIKKRQGTLKRNKDTSMTQIIEAINVLKDKDATRLVGYPWGECQPPIEAINYNLVRRMKFYSFSLRCYGSSPEPMSSHIEATPKCVEAHNIATIERFILQEPLRMYQLCEVLREKMEEFIKIHAIDIERFGLHEYKSTVTECTENVCDSGSDSSFEV